MGAFLTYALDESEALIHVDDVAKGNNCKCHCPHCGAPLCAKNAGKQRQHHFAHAHGHECEGAYESQLHLLAKEILQETRHIMLPPSLGEVFPTGLVRLHNIQVEQWDDKYHIKPDVVHVLYNGRIIKNQTTIVCTTEITNEIVLMIYIARFKSDCTTRHVRIRLDQLTTIG